MDERLRQGFRLNEYLVEPGLCRITGPGGVSHVEPRVMDVLLELASHAGEPVMREYLFASVWKHRFVTDGVLTRCISQLRQHFGEGRGERRFIETLSKRGYRLLAPIALDPIHSPRAAARGHAVSIVVLPFLNLSGNPADEYVADGLTELLIAVLAGLSALRVIARTSAMHYKHTQLRVREIAEELKVDRIVEGSLLLGDHQVQVVVQLIDGRSEIHEWARTYTREPRDLLTLLNEVARTIGDEVRTTLTPAEASRLTAPLPISEDALKAYLRGRSFWAQRSPDGLYKAIDQFQVCLRIAPDFAPAHCGIAEACVVLALYGIAAPRDVYPRALASAARAYAIDPDNGRAAVAVGLLKMFHDHDFSGAEAMLVRAGNLMPSEPLVHLGYGDLLICTGRFDQGLREIRRAVELSPFDLGLNMNVGDYLIFSRRFDQAVRQLETTLTMDPQFVPARMRLAEAHAFLGEGDAARLHSERAVADSPSPARVHEAHAFVLAATGARSEAVAILEQLESHRGKRYVPAWDMARAYAVMGEAEPALRWLEAGMAERAPFMVTVGVYAAFDPIRTDPRFVDIIRRLGLASALLTQA
jgi:TolB-like protein/Flp pilus assembly protein TadD